MGKLSWTIGTVIGFIFITFLGGCLSMAGAYWTEKFLSRKYGALPVSIVPNTTGKEDRVKAQPS